MSPAHDVGEYISLVHGLHSLHDVIRVTGIGIERHKTEHAADLEIGIDLMALLHDDRGGHHLIVGRLIERLLGIFKLREADAGIGPAENIDSRIGLIVDLVEGHPIFDLILVALHDAQRVAHKEVHQFAVDPAAVFLCQVIRHFEMAQRDHGLYAVL